MTRPEHVPITEVLYAPRAAHSSRNLNALPHVGTGLGDTQSCRQLLYKATKTAIHESLLLVSRGNTERGVVTFVAIPRQAWQRPGWPIERARRARVVEHVPGLVGGIALFLQ
jgi:hypothetical protein